MAEIRVSAWRNAGGPMVPANLTAFLREVPDRGHDLHLGFGMDSLVFAVAHPDPIEALGRKLIELADQLRSSKQRKA